MKENTKMIRKNTQKLKIKNIFLVSNLAFSIPFLKDLIEISKLLFELEFYYL